MSDATSQAISAAGHRLEIEVRQHGLTWRGRTTYLNETGFYARLWPVAGHRVTESPLPIAEEDCEVFLLSSAISLPPIVGHVLTVAGSWLPAYCCYISVAFEGLSRHDTHIIQEYVHRQASTPALREWYVHRSDGTFGPLSKEEVEEGIASEVFRAGDLVWLSAEARWAALESATVFLASFAPESGPAVAHAHVPAPAEAPAPPVTFRPRRSPRLARLAVDFLAGLTAVLVMGFAVFNMTRPPQAESPPPFQRITPNEYTGPLIRWLRGNVTPLGMPLSFAVAAADTRGVYLSIGDPYSVPDIMERIIVNEGLIVYDGAVWQMLLAATDSAADLRRAEVPIQHYYRNRVGLIEPRGGEPTFVYGSARPGVRPQRGFVFKIIDAAGRYNTADPLDGKTEIDGYPNSPRIHWEDWKPIAGENAWVAMAALQIYHRKHYDARLRRYRHPRSSVELDLARQLADCAIRLQADNGGIRMGPMGIQAAPGGDSTYWYREISTENNFSWYTALRMLYTITREEKYRAALARVQGYLRWSYCPDEHIFAQGAHWHPDSGWIKNPVFAVDCQTWGIDALGPRVIDQWFGDGAAFRIWRATRDRAGYLVNGRLMGIGFTDGHDQLSVEWTAGAILTTRILANYYSRRRLAFAEEAFGDCRNMRAGVDLIRTRLPGGRAAYSYSLRRDYIPFGWWAHHPQVLSTVATCWIVMMDHDYNPFQLGGVDENLPVPEELKPPKTLWDYATDPAKGSLVLAMLLFLLVLIHLYRRYLRPRTIR